MNLNICKQSHSALKLLPIQIKEGAIYRFVPEPEQLIQLVKHM